MYAKIGYLVCPCKNRAALDFRGPCGLVFTPYLVIGHKIKVYSWQYIVQDLKVIPIVSPQIYKKITYLRHAIAAKAITLPESGADIKEKDLDLA